MDSVPCTELHLSDGCDDDRTVADVPIQHLAERTIPHHVRHTLDALAAGEATAGDQITAKRPLSGPGTALMGPGGVIPALPAGIRRIDCSGRLNAKPLCASLDWPPGTSIGFRRTPHGFVATPTESSGGRSSLTGTVDSESRIRLPRGVRRWLDPDDSGVVIARARSGLVELYSAALLDRLLDDLIAPTDEADTVPSPN